MDRNFSLNVSCLLFKLFVLCSTKNGLFFLIKFVSEFIYSEYLISFWGIVLEEMVKKLDIVKLDKTFLVLLSSIFMGLDYLLISKVILCFHRQLMINVKVILRSSLLLFVCDKKKCATFIRVSKCYIIFNTVTVYIVFCTKD